MVEIREVRVADYIAQAEALIRKNWDETGFDFPLAVSVELYSQMQDMGLLFMLAAFHDGDLVGYSSATIVGHQFNPSVLICASDALFVDPDHRSGLLTARLLQATERVAKERGAQRMIWRTRAGTPFAAMLMRRGYNPAEQTVMKRL